MRIAIVTESFLPSLNGVTTSVCRVLDHLAARGHEAVVICPGPAPERYGQFRVRTVQGLTVRQFRIGLPTADLERILREEKPDVVHAASPFGIGWRGLAAARNLGIPTVAIYQTDMPSYLAQHAGPLAGRITNVSWRWIRHLHSLADITLAPSSATLCELGAHGVPRAALWSRGVDTELFRPRPPDAPDLAGLPRPIFLSVGRVAVEKNIEAFLETDLPGTKIIVGDGPARAELEAKYPEAKFLGARFGEELARCFRDADVFVFPSWTDTFGLVILEAMAAGTPVAAYPAHGPIDIIPGSNAGAINRDLTTACLECLDLDRKAVRAYAEKFSWRASAEQFVENLQPYPEPERGRFWRRLRRIARVRRQPLGRHRPILAARRRGHRADLFGQPCLADPGRAEQDHVLRLRDPGRRREVRENVAAQRGLVVGVEVLEGLHGGEVRAGDAEAGAVRFPVRDLALQHRGEVFLV